MKKRITTASLMIIMLGGIFCAMLFSAMPNIKKESSTVYAQENSIAYQNNKEKEDFATFNQLLKKEEPLTWTFNGSSTTANDGHYSNNYRNYIEIIESRMRTELSRESDRFINLAVGGYTVNSFSYFDAGDADSYSPDIAYINIGKNDSRYFMSMDGSFYYSGTTPPPISKRNPNLLYFKAKVEKLVDDARSRGALVILGVPNSMKMNFGEVQQRIFYEEYFGDVIRDIAEEKQVLLVDYLDYFMENRANADNFWYREDGIHCNELGYLEHAKIFFDDLGLYDGDSIFSKLSFADLANKPYAPYFTPIELQTDEDFSPDFDEVEPIFEAIINQDITSSLNYTEDALDAANQINDYGAGTLVMRFRTTSTAASKRMLALSAEEEKDSSVMLSAAYQRNFHCMQNGSLWTVSNIEVNDGAWHTAVVVSSDSGTQIYIDGGLQYSNTKNLFGTGIPYTRVIIGGTTVDDANHFIGDISYLRMFKGELFAGQAIEISEENLPDVQETQLMEEYGYAPFSEINLSGLAKKNPIVFMGGAATIGVMKESVAERSFSQHLFKNSAKTDFQMLGGTISELEGLCTRVKNESVVFFMPEIINKNGRIIDESINEYKEKVINILDALAKDKDCYVVVLTPYPVLNNSVLNEQITEYVVALKTLVTNRGLVSLDLFSYFQELSVDNPSISNNWVESSGLPNYIGHFEIAKRMSIFLGWGTSSVTTSPTHVLQFTNPSATTGTEYDNLSAIISQPSDSKSTRLFDVNTLIKRYPNATFEFSIGMGEISSKVKATDGIISQKHPLKGNYTFTAKAQIGEKTILFRSLNYAIIELDDSILPVDEQPIIGGRKGLAVWQIVLICVGGFLILCVIGVFVFEKQLKEILNKLKSKNNAKTKSVPSQKEEDTQIGENGKVEIDEVQVEDKTNIDEVKAEDKENVEDKVEVSALLKEDNKKQEKSEKDIEGDDA